MDQKYCPNCGEEWGPKVKYEDILFEESGLKVENKIYILVIECPICFEKFWFHGGELHKQFLRDGHRF